jgi:branched-subunit amino acid aminotransferase/4-amino-4-deoxychorismate lyase
MISRRPFPEGTGIFETLRTEGGLIAELTRHMRRAKKSAQALNIPMPDEEILRSEIDACMTLNPHPIGRLRICFSRSGFLVTHDPYEDIRTLARVTFHSTSSKSSGAQIKVYPYDWNYQVLDSARDFGFDDAILFNASNQVTETSISNLIFKLEGAWVTPPISAGILPGIMRGLAIERCGVTVRNIHVSDIPMVEEAMLVSSLKIAQPISHIGDFAMQLQPAVSELEEKIRASVEFFSVR